MNMDLDRKWSYLQRLSILFLLSASAIYGGDSINMHLSAINDFLTQKQHEIIDQEIQIHVLAEREFETVKWLTNSRFDGQIDLNDKKLWSFYFPCLWRLLYTSKSTPGHLKKCIDEKLFIAFLDIYLSPRLTVASDFVGNVICIGFDKRIIDKYAASLMRPFTTGKRDPRFMIGYHIPKDFATKFPDYFNRQFKINRDKLCASSSLLEKCGYLHFNAYFREQEAIDKLIELFQTCPSDDESVLEFNFLLHCMFMIASKDSLIAVLSRFPEEIGAPEFDVSGYKRCSPRYQILSSFQSLYPNDGFFLKYSNYLRNHTGAIMDNEIGGEKGVQKLFDEFKAWAKVKFNYEMDLSRSTPHINLQRLRYDMESDWN